MPEELATHPELGPELSYLWGYFLELHNERGSNGMTPNPINSFAIKSWMDLTGIRLRGWEIRAIRKAETAYQEHVAEASKMKRPST